ncbi:hypothetical protein JR334_09495 [Clostridia bacterium]|nr:hypothetical protein JR334_09495 [Clostridia bacterium]
MNKKGSTTILFAILLPLLLLFGMFIFEALWESLARTYFDQACYSATRSCLADYDTSVWQDYGVFLFQDEPDAKQLKEDIESNLDSNNWLKLQVTRVQAQSIEPLERDVLKRQILENVKYVAPIRGARALWDLVSHLKSSESYSHAGAKAEQLEMTQENMKRTEENNRKIKDKKKDIKSLRRSISAAKKEDPPDSARIDKLERKVRSKEREIDKLYDENRDLTYKTQDILTNQGLSQVPEEVDAKQMAEESRLQSTLDKMTKAKKRTEERLGWRDGATDQMISGSEIDTEDCENALNLIQAARDILKEGRDRFYLGEYALKYFSDVTSDSHEAEIEYLITGAKHPGASYGLRLLAERVALDSLGYFLLDPKSPPELLARTIYSLVSGGIQGLIDLYYMVGLEEAVPLIHITPGTTNPFKNILLDYEDHQRLDLLLTGEEKKLDRIQELLPVAGYTGKQVLIEARIRRIFPFRIIRNDEAQDDANYVHLRKEICICY